MRPGLRRDSVPIALSFILMAACTARPTAPDDAEPAADPGEEILRLEVQPERAVVQPNDTVVFNAIIVVSDDGTPTPDLEWSASGGTITSDGVFVAGTQAGSIEVIVRARGRDREARAEVVVGNGPPETDPPEPQDVQPNGPTGDWALAFYDEFDGSGLDRSKWNMAWPWSNAVINGELQMYDGDPDIPWHTHVGGHVVVRDGSLNLIATDDTITDGGGWHFDYISGAINTRDKFHFTYGVFEVRAFLPAGRGLWPQLWLNPQEDGVWPPEIDLMEAIGDELNKVHHNVHWLDGNNDHQALPGVVYGEDWFADWHTYTLEWNEDEVVFWIDGVETYRLAGHSSRIPMNLMLNLAVGGGWPGSPDASTRFPAVFEVDYVRVWQ